MSRGAIQKARGENEDVLCLCPVPGRKQDHLAEARFAVRRQQVHQRPPLKKTSPSPRGIQMPLQEQQRAGESMPKDPGCHWKQVCGQRRWCRQRRQAGKGRTVAQEDIAHGKEPLFWVAAVNTKRH